MKITITYLIPILLLLICFNQKQIDLPNNGIAEFETELKFISKNQKSDNEYQNTIADTLTNWRFYLDDRIIWVSHIGNSQKEIVEISTRTEYEFFKFQIFYDFHHSVDERKIEMIIDDEPFKIYTQTNETILPFLINKWDLELIAEEYFNREITIKFYDPINPNGLEVGTIKIIAE